MSFNIREFIRGSDDVYMLYCHVNSIRSVRATVQHCGHQSADLALTGLIQNKP